MGSDFEIGKRTGKCSATERALTEGESYYAVVLETAEGFERRDYTLESWTGPPEGAFCYWRGRVPAKDRSRGPVVVDTPLLVQLFLGLEEEDAQTKQQFRFVLSLLLMRKRLLKLAGTAEEDGKEYWRLVLMSDKSEHRVLNPLLTPNEIERLSAQLTAILSGEVEANEALEWTEVPRPAEDEAEAGSEGTPAGVAGDEAAADEGSPDAPGAATEQSEEEASPSAAEMHSESSGGDFGESEAERSDEIT